MSIVSHWPCELTHEKTKGGNQLVPSSFFRSPSRRVSRFYLLPPPPLRGVTARICIEGPLLGRSGDPLPPVDCREMPDCESSFGNLRFFPFHENSANKGTKCRLSRRRLPDLLTMRGTKQYADARERGSGYTKKGKYRKEIKYNITNVYDSNQTYRTWIRDGIKHVNKECTVMFSCNQLKIKIIKYKRILI